MFLILFKLYIYFCLLFLITIDCVYNVNINIICECDVYITDRIHSKKKNLNTSTCKELFKNMVNISNTDKSLYEDCLECKNIF